MKYHLMKDYDPETAGKLYVYCGWLYENTNDDMSSPMTDELFDRLSIYLQAHYDETSDWFKNKVTKGMLKAGTASGIQLNEREQKVAIELSKQ